MPCGYRRTDDRPVRTPCGGFHRGPLADLSTAEYDRLRADIIAAESIGLNPSCSIHSSPRIRAAGTAAAWVYAAAFLGVGIAGLFLTLQSRVSRDRPTPEGGS